jgi:mannose-1-phosphate guanylyltransferase
MTPGLLISASEHRSITAVILCGGRGERLRPMTDLTPKPLIPVNGRPMLGYLIEHLLQSGLGEFLLCVGYKAEMFEAYAGQLESSTSRIRCVNSGEAGITKRLVDARPFVRDRALVCYADTLADVDVRELISVHEERKAQATITVHPYQSSFGLVSFDEAGFVSRFEEKPRLPYWVNIGFILMEPAALDRLNSERSFPEFLAELAARRELGVYRHPGKHWTANTGTELRELAARLEESIEEQEIA